MFCSFALFALIHSNYFLLLLLPNWCCWCLNSPFILFLFYEILFIFTIVDNNWKIIFDRYMFTSSVYSTYVYCMNYIVGLQFFFLSLLFILIFSKCSILYMHTIMVFFAGFCLFLCFFLFYYFFVACDNILYLALCLYI